jgi:parvulin-like peptidyl-prolyl isomerase
MKHTILISVFLILPVLAAEAQKTAPPSLAVKVTSPHNAAQEKPAAKVVARVNGAALTDADLQREMLAMFPYARQHGGKIPPSMEATVRMGALQMIEFEELVYQEAQRRKMQINSAHLDYAMAQFRQQFDSEGKFQEFLKAELHGSRKLLRDKIRRSLLIDQLLDLEVTSKSSISDQEVRSYYEKNATEFHVAERVAVQTISVVIPDDATAKDEATARRHAEDVLKQARATKSYEAFGALAEKASDDEWRVMMGDHGAIEESKMPPQVAKIAFALKPGQISDLIRAENSFCVVRLNSHEAAKQQPFEQVRAQIKKNLQARRVDQLRSALNHQLRKTAKVTELS